VPLPCDTEQAWERRDGKAGTVQRSGRDRGPPPDGADTGPGAGMPEYGETGTRGETKTFPRVTGLPPGRDTVMSAMRRGRRWATGNGTFRTPGRGTLTGPDTVPAMATATWRTSS